ncbi:MAG: hypothetical protein R3B09_25135 [Nannocystaceae bacterium]
MDRFALNLVGPLTLALAACSGGSGSTASDTAGESSSGSITASDSVTVTASGTESDTASTSMSGTGTASASSSTTAGETEGTSASTSMSGTASTTGPTTSESSTATDSSTTMMASTTNTGTDTDVPPGCGNGVIDPGEECDDGPANGPGEACKANCVADACGDGDKGPNEECDEGAMNGPDGGCSAMCTINPSACGEQAYDAMLEILPVDIIIAIDNSGSMGQEIVGVQNNINQNFAQIIENSGIDYRVIMVTRHGKANPDESVCIEAPLSGIPMGGCANPPTQPVFNPGKFYHYSIEVASNNALCLLGTSYNGTTKDVFNLEPNGWQTWLRLEALKVFVVITDDRVNCSWNGTMNDANTVAAGNTVATQWEQKIETLAPEHFGTDPQNRNFQFYSIVGMAFNNPQDKAWTPKDAIQTAKCNTAANPGTGYQALSNNTEVIRFPLCDTTSYDVIFQAIADGVIKGAKIVCDFPIPEPPMGKTLDLDSIKVEYTPGMGVPQVFDQVPSVDMCTPTSFYIDGGEVHLCPDACTAVQSDKDANIQLKFACEPIDPG